MRQRTVILGSTLSVSLLVLSWILWATGPAHAQPDPSDFKGKADYVGLTKCAACHFDQYKDWKTSEHGKAFEILPQKYRKDAECLSCHATGLARRAASNSAVSIASRLSRHDALEVQNGVSCEACHGPGGEHAKFALKFIEEPITEDALKLLRSKIHRLDMVQCVKCHVDKGHKKHPPFDRDPPVQRQPAAARQSSSFFQRVHDQGTKSS